MKPRLHFLCNVWSVAYCFASMAVMTGIAAESHAATKVWDHVGGGNFSTSSNWKSRGFFCNPVPNSNDLAFFGLSDPSSLFQFVYTVTFSANVTNQALVIEDDFVTFDLNGHTYTTTTSDSEIADVQGGRSAGSTIVDGAWNFNLNDVVIIGPHSDGSRTGNVGNSHRDGCRHWSAASRYRIVSTINS